MTIIKINAVWCPGCLIMRPVWKQIQNLKPSIKIKDYDYDLDATELKKWNIGNKLPVAIVLNDEEQEVTRIIGEKSKNEILSILKELEDI